MATIYWAGDSTVQYNDITTFPQTGIGQVFHLFLKPGVKVVNYAKNGRSTKSFIDEGRMKPIEDQIKAGDFLFIQFKSSFVYGTFGVISYRSKCPASAIISATFPVTPLALKYATNFFPIR